MQRKREDNLAKCGRGGIVIKIPLAESQLWFFNNGRVISWLLTEKVLLQSSLFAAVSRQLKKQEKNEAQQRTKRGEIPQKGRAEMELITITIKRSAATLLLRNAGVTSPMSYFPFRERIGGHIGSQERRHLNSAPKDEFELGAVRWRLAPSKHSYEL